MKALDRSSVSSLAGRTLKFAGLMLILFALIDFVIILLPQAPPAQAPTDLDTIRQQLSITSQLVDRGITPVVGLSLLLTGFWVDSQTGVNPRQQGIWQSVKMLALVLASLLGLVFLLIVPLHLNNARLASQQALEQLNKEVTQAESQLSGKLNEEVTRQRNQITAMIQDEKMLEAAIASGQVPPNQAELLRKFRKDPKALDQFLESQTKQIRAQVQGQIQSRRQSVQSQATSDAWKTAIRTGLTSLLLAIVYTVIGWTGLRDLRHPGVANTRTESSDL